MPLTPVTSILNLVSSMNLPTSWLNVTISPGSASPMNLMGQCFGMTVMSYFPGGTSPATLMS